MSELVTVNAKVFKYHNGDFCTTCLVIGAAVEREREKTHSVGHIVCRTPGNMKYFAAWDSVNSVRICS